MHKSIDVPIVSLHDIRLNATAFSYRLRTSAVYMRNAKIIRHGKRVRITLDIAEALVQDIDQIRESIGVDRAALIKIWLHERVQQEKAALFDQ